MHLSARKLDKMIEEATVDCYDELEQVTPATAFEGKTARGNLGWLWLRVRGRHGP
jgi:hypothetical protein